MGHPTFLPSGKELWILHCLLLPTLLLNSVHAFNEYLSNAGHVPGTCVLETPWRAEINQVEGIAHAQSPWQKGGWAVRRTERMVLWLEQRKCRLHTVQGGWRRGKVPACPTPCGQSCSCREHGGKPPSVHRLQTCCLSAVD